ncbi:MAG TPA: hypothetical protein VK956_15205, partial [Verrucomicrobium sp.]|nr:hypothetical protein [Verrucomicrobium sp.]
MNLRSSLLVLAGVFQTSLMCLPAQEPVPPAPAPVAPVIPPAPVPVPVPTPPVIPKPPVVVAPTPAAPPEGVPVRERERTVY